MLLITWKIIEAKRKSLKSCGEDLAICIQSEGGNYKFSLSERAILPDRFFFSFFFFYLHSLC